MEIKPLLIDENLLCSENYLDTLITEKTGLFSLSKLMPESDCLILGFVKWDPQRGDDSVVGEKLLVFKNCENLLIENISFESFDDLSLFQQSGIYQVGLIGFDCSKSDSGYRFGFVTTGGEIYFQISGLPEGFEIRFESTLKLEHYLKMQTHHNILTLS